MNLMNSLYESMKKHFNAFILLSFTIYMLFVYLLSVGESQERSCDFSHDF